MLATLSVVGRLTLLGVVIAATPSAPKPPAPDRTAPIRDYADCLLRFDRQAVTIVRCARGRFAQPTSLIRFRGRFEARALGRDARRKQEGAAGAVVLEFVRFDFPLLADAESPEDTSAEAQKVAAALRAGVSASTQVRVPLPEGTESIAVYDGRTKRTVRLDLTASAASEGAPRPP